MAGPTDPTPEALPDDVPDDPAAVAALIAEQRTRVVEAIDVDARLLFGVWGVAWVLGFTAMWLGTRDDIPETAAGLTFAGLLVLAGVVTAIHIGRSSTGVRGPSAQQGAFYGWSWSLSFLVVAALGTSLGRADVDPEVFGLVMTVVPCLVVAALYMAGGAMWRTTSFFALGAWIAVVTAVAAVVGGATMLLVMALAGGGGMLAFAGYAAVDRRRRRAALADGAA